MEQSKAEKYVTWRLQNKETYLENARKQNEKRKIKNAEKTIIKLQQRIETLNLLIQKKLNNENDLKI